MKYLKVSQELIKPCSCKKKVYHQYCMTAYVIRNNTIFCQKCDMAYDIFVKKEKFFNGKILRLLFTYCLFMVVIFIFAAVTLIIDGYLKTMEAHRNPEQATINHNFLLRERKIHPWSFNIVPDYRKPFSLKDSIRWTDMIHLVAI